jgi:hypothetical protein
LAALSTSGMKALVLPPIVRTVVILGDHDANGAGERAARIAAARWQVEGRRVRLAMPPEPGNLVIRDVVIGEGSGKQWALLPSKAMIDRDGNLMHDAAGKIRYAPVIEWGTPALREEFSRRVADIVVRHWPGAFDQ